MIRSVSGMLVGALVGLAGCGLVATDPDGTGGGAGSTGQAGSTADGGAGTGGSNAGGSTGTAGSGAGGSHAGGSGAGGSNAGGSGAGGSGGACTEELPPNPPSGGGNGPMPSKCHCDDEAPALLDYLQGQAAAHHAAVGHSCGTAVSIPGVPPLNTYYWVSTQESTDFQSGDDTTGWTCLGVSMPPIVHCQYHYARGQAPLTAYVTGEAPVLGPDDVEIAAVGDTDGDGILAIYAVIGRVGPDGQLAFDPILIVDPTE